jgi:hypothetical protein
VREPLPLSLPPQLSLVSCFCFTPLMTFLLRRLVAARRVIYSLALKEQRRPEAPSMAHSCHVAAWVRP